MDVFVISDDDAVRPPILPYTLTRLEDHSGGSVGMLLRVQFYEDRMTAWEVLAEVLATLK